MISTVLLAFMAMSLTAQNKIVERPASVHSNTTIVEIERVVLTDTATVLDIAAFYRPKWWIKITSDSYLLADGKKYMIRRGEGISLDSLFWMPKTGEASFSLAFEPLPANTSQFDFIEGDCDDCFKIWGVDLVNERIPMPEIEAKYTSTSFADSEMNVTLKKGKAKISGMLLGYKPQYGMRLKLVYYNPVTANPEEETFMPESDGSFYHEMEVLSPTQLCLTYDAPQTERFWFVSAPGEQTDILLNLPEINRSRSKLHKDTPAYGERVMYAGYQARLNNDLNSPSLVKEIFTDAFMEDIYGMSFEEYCDYVLENYNEAVKANNAAPVSSLAKKVASMQLAFDLNGLLMSGESYLAQAYVEKDKMDWREAMSKITLSPKPEDYNGYLVNISYPYNDADLLLVQSLPQYLRMLSYIRNFAADKQGLLRYLAKSDDVKSEDKKVLSEYLTQLEKNEFAPDSALLSIFNKYRNLEEKYSKETSGMHYLSMVWNIDDCILFDLMKANELCRGIVDYTPLSEEQTASLSTIDPTIRNAIIEENHKLLAKIEENKKKTGYTVLDVPEVDNSQLFAEMIKPFKGKVVLVDVWETWCGPCRAANQAMIPLKAQMANKEMVYLYLASESSPENAWRNMITDLHGYHYRVNEMQSVFLREQLKSRGVPTYIILDKDGEQTFHAVGFPGVDTMKKELKKALGE